VTAATLKNELRGTVLPDNTNNTSWEYTILYIRYKYMLGGHATKKGCSTIPNTESTQDWRRFWHVLIILSAPEVPANDNTG
jgi:hypothetical protein